MPESVFDFHFNKSVYSHPRKTTMSKSNNSRKFERFLFKGIHEQPEPNWQRTANSNVDQRTTGGSLGTFSGEINLDDYSVIGSVKYDHENKTEVVNLTSES